MVNIVIGCQWGDEGKGKVVDMLSREHDIIVRYQGGANAGHTVEIEDKKYILHLIPSGILWQHTQCVIGNGVVLDPFALLGELDTLITYGVGTEGRLFISENCHLIMPYHKTIDKIGEENSLKIGTTGRGIGPCYVDKAARRGIRFADLFNSESFAQLLRRNLQEKDSLLRAHGVDTLKEYENTMNLFSVLPQKLSMFRADTVALLNERRSSGKKILLEGAQGTLLDVDHGSYPFVTSSNPTTGGAFTGTGLPPNSVSRIYGVLKAYTTRVGEGPFPTELNDGTGEELRLIGHEFGATTGRPRRCGWFDAPLAKYSLTINGVTDIALTKLDVLDSFQRIMVCVAYEVDGETSAFSNGQLQRMTPIYKEMKGWNVPTDHCRDFSELPEAARDYVLFLENLLECPITFVSTGAKRHQIITR